MTDVVEKAVRSRMMSAIRGKHTQPELAVRRYLHAMGYRFRLHRRDLPGQPDLVMARFRLAIFVHGCFWHRHPGCFYATSPASRTEFWRAKLDGNAERDRRQLNDLAGLGWRTLVVWECGLRHLTDRLQELTELIGSDDLHMEWPAIPPRQRTTSGSSVP